MPIDTPRNDGMRGLCIFLQRLCGAHPAKCPDCGVICTKVIESYTRYMDTRFDVEKQRFYIDTAWPPNLDDGAGDYELQCGECYAVWRLPLTEGGQGWEGDV